MSCDILKYILDHTILLIKISNGSLRCLEWSPDSISLPTILNITWYHPAWTFVQTSPHSLHLIPSKPPFCSSDMQSCFSSRGLCTVSSFLCIETLTYRPLHVWLLLSSVQISPVRWSRLPIPTSPTSFSCASHSACPCSVLFPSCSSSGCSLTPWTISGEWAVQQEVLGTSIIHMG